MVTAVVGDGPKRPGRICRPTLELLEGRVVQSGGLSGGLVEHATTLGSEVSASAIRAVFGPVGVSPTLTVTTPVQAPVAHLQSVTFGGGGFHPISSDPSFAIDDGNPIVYTSKQWTSKGAGSTASNLGAPVLYAAGGQLNVSASWDGVRGFKVGDTIYARGLGPDGIEIGPSLVQRSGDKLIVSAAQSDQKLDRAAAYDPDFKIQWQLSKDHKKTWISAGTSDDPLYVSAGKPIADPDTGNFFLTVVDAAVKRSVGESGRPALIASIWSGFTGLDVMSKEGDPLQYYGNPKINNVTVAGLLRDRDGQCSTWTKLFLDELLVDGIRGSNDYVVLKAKHSTGFLVKSYAFSGGILSTVPGYPYINLIDSPKGATEVDAVDASGNVYKVPAIQDVFRNVAGSDMIRGQNSANPASTFNNHQMAYIDGQFYDPSYGATFTSLPAIAKTAIAGYYKDEAKVYLPAASLGIKLKPDATSNKVKLEHVRVFAPNAPGVDTLSYQARFSYGE